MTPFLALVLAGFAAFVVILGFYSTRALLDARDADRRDGA